MKTFLKLIIISSLLAVLTIGCSEIDYDEYNTEIDDTRHYNITDNEKELLFGHWKIKKLIGFSHVNDDIAEIQNSPDGPKILNSDIYISSTNIKYNIDIDTKNPIPDNYISESVNDYEVNKIHVDRSVSVNEFYSSQAKLGGFRIYNEDAPKENVKYISVSKKGEDYFTPLLLIFDNNKVVWYMYGAYFELEKVS